MHNQTVREIHHDNYYSKTKMEQRVLRASYNDSAGEESCLNYYLSTAEIALLSTRQPHMYICSVKIAQ